MGWRTLTVLGLVIWVSVATIPLQTFLSHAQAGGASPGQLCSGQTQRVMRFTVPLLTEHWFMAWRRADGGAGSFGFNYPPTWRVTINPPNVNQWDFRYARAELLFTPDAQGITHGYMFLPQIQPGVVSLQDAIGWYVQGRFQNFRLRGRLDVPGANIPGYQAAASTLFYSARYKNRPVEGVVTVEALRFADPMLGGAVTILAFNQLQIAADLPAVECYEKLNALVSIVLSARKVTEIGDWNEGKRWIDALGGLTQARDPRTGESFLVPFTYRYWWRDGNTLLGTNDPARQAGTLLQLP